MLGAGISIWEAVGCRRAERVAERLRNLPEGDSLFCLNSASRPIPFFPDRILVTRQKLVKSTKNGRRLGSVYNNWSLPTVFDESERGLKSIEDVMRICKVSAQEFKEMSCTFFHANSLSGNPQDVKSWSGMNSDNVNNIPEDVDWRIRGLLRACGKGATFAVLKGCGVISIRGINVATIDEIRRALDKLFVAKSLSRKIASGILVPDLGRSLLFWMWFVVAASFITYGAAKQWSDLELWTIDYFEALVFSIISLPALVEFITDEPSVVRNAIKGTKVLWKNSQVRSFFNLTSFDYAVMALLDDEMWLVSDDTACFTQHGGHTGMVGDVTLTDTDALRRVGVYVGRSMARKEWEDTNVQVTFKSNGSVHIFRRASDARWISGEGRNRPVGATGGEATGEQLKSVLPNTNAVS